MGFFHGHKNVQEEPVPNSLTSRIRIRNSGLLRIRKKHIFKDPFIDDHLLNSEEEVLPVLLRDGGEVGVGAGQVAPLPAPQVPAVLHHPDDKVIANLLYRASHAHFIYTFDTGGF